MKSNYNFTIMIFILIITYWFCSSNQKYPANIELVNGIKIISNPEYSKNTDKGYVLKELISIGVEDGDDNYIFHGVRDIAVDYNDNIYILDAGNYRIQVFNSEGRYLKTISKNGQGPGEMLRPNTLDISSKRRIYVYDDGNSRVTIFGKDGAYLSDFKIQQPFISDIFVDLSDYLYFNTSAAFNYNSGPNGYMETERIVQIAKYDTLGKQIYKFGDFPGLKSEYYRIKGISICGIGTDLEQTIWTADQKGNIYIANADNYEISHYSSEGKIIKKFERKFKRIEYTAKEINDVINDPRNRNVPNYIKKKLVFSNYKIAIQSLIVDEEGNLWVNTSQKGDAEGYAFDIFNPDGIYTDRVVLPEKPRLFKNGFVYTRTSIFDGVEKIKKCKLLPKSS